MKTINVKKIEELSYNDSINREITILHMLSHPGIDKFIYKIFEILEMRIAIFLNFKINAFRNRQDGFVIQVYRICLLGA